MIRLYNEGVYLIDGTEIVPESEAAGEPLLKSVDPEAAAKETIAYSILKNHNTSGNLKNLEIRFDKLTSHDITYVGIIQTARASGLEKFSVPYVLTNCHNSLCAVGGTINEDDHMFGLTCAKKYGGAYVPPHQAVIHQYAREMLAEAGAMILGSDSHTRYGALGTMAMGEGGPELVKQLLGKTYDIPMPQVIAVYLDGEPPYGVGPQDVALSIIKAVFANGYVKNKVMEFVGPGVSSLSADYRIGIDVMTTETTCLSSIWKTDEKIREFYEIHGRESAYTSLEPGKVAHYDGMVYVDLSSLVPVMAMPFHPSNVYTISEVKKNAADILHEVELKGRVSLGEDFNYSLKDKLRNGNFCVDQGIIAGCAGGGFENICAAADILKGRDIGNGEFTFNVYPASMPIYMELIKNGTAAQLMEAGTVIKTAFCGPCFGAGDTPANNAFSIRHSTRNFPNREGSKLQNGQISSVALMDARSIAATAANKGVLTGADEMDVEYKGYRYFFDSSIYDKRVFDSHGIAEPETKIHFGPNIKDWPGMEALPENLLLKVVSEIHDPVTTTDELIPSGETSSYRSNPLGLAEFALSRKDPAYVGRAKAVRAAQEAIVNGECPVKALDELKDVFEIIEKNHPEIMNSALNGCLNNVSGNSIAHPEKASEITKEALGIGSTIYAVKPGDGSAREQAASCQKVLGGWANIAGSYATKRYRSNLINWGMLPLIYEQEKLEFGNDDYILIPGIRNVVSEGCDSMDAYVIGKGREQKITLKMGALTDTEKEIILKGCLINYYRG